MVVVVVVVEEEEELQPLRHLPQLLPPRPLPLPPIALPVYGAAWMACLRAVPS